VWKWFLFFILSPTLSSLALIAVVNTGVLQPQIDSFVKAHSGGVIQELGPVRIALSWPPTIAVGPSRLGMGSALAMNFEQMRLSVANFWAPYDVRLKWVRPQIKVHGRLQDMQMQSSSPQTSGSAGSSNASGPGATAKDLPIRLTVDIQDGVLQAQDLSITQWQLHFSQKRLLQSPAKVKTSLKVQHEMLPAPLPLELQTDSLTLSPEAVKASDLNVALSGVKALLGRVLI